VTAYNSKESGGAIRRIVAKGESNPAPLSPDDKLFSITGSEKIYISTIAILAKNISVAGR
jgi:hypothetical protein